MGCGQHCPIQQSSRFFKRAAQLLPGQTRCGGVSRDLTDDIDEVICERVPRSFAVPEF